MKIHVLLFIIVLATFDSNAQSKKSISPLKYIDHYPVKTEDGCGFFSDDLSSINKKKFLFIITPNHMANKPVAYAQIEKNTFLYFTHLKRITSDKGYTDFYKGKDNVSVVLKINRIDQFGKHSLRYGKLYITLKKAKKEIDVCGYDEEIDKYNYPAMFK